MYNLVEYSDNHSKTSGSLRKYYKGEPNYTLADSESFKCKVKITGNNPAYSNKKKCWNYCTIFKQLLENSWNTID